MSVRQLGSMPLMNHCTALHCCLLLDQLKKDWYMLQQEAMNIFHLEVEYNQKLALFIKGTQEVDIMVKSLWSLAEELQPDNESKSSIYDFVSRMAKSWCNSDEAIAQEVGNVQIISCTTSDIPLLLVLERIQGSTNTIMETFKTISGHFSCFSQSVNMYHKIIPVTLRLSQGNLTYRHFLSLDKAIPFIRDIKVMVKSFIENLMPDHSFPVSLHTETDCDYQIMSTFKQTEKEEDKHQQLYYSNDLSTFHFVAKLLTGELLGHEQPLDYNALIEPIVTDETPEILSPATVTPPTKPRLTVEISQHQCNPHELYCLVNDIQGMEMYIPDDRVWQQMHNNPLVWSTNTHHHDLYQPYGIIESRMGPALCYSENQNCFHPNGSYVDQDRLLQYQRTNEICLGRDENQLSTADYTNIANEEDNSLNNAFQEAPKPKRSLQTTKRRLLASKTKSPDKDIDDLQPIKVPRLQQNLFRPLL